MAMTLSSMLGGVAICGIRGRSDAMITGITADSRRVREGFLFAAVRGTERDGNEFIGAALEKGAAALLVEKGTAADAAVAEDRAVVEVENPRAALGLAAAAFYGCPSERLGLAGITGTNGKTTTAYLLEAILKEAGYSPGVIGTVNYRYGGKVLEAPNTTPEPTELQRLLSDMAAAGTTHCVMEVSSHALHQDRVAGCAFRAAIFTNLTQDHLDYHPTMEAYGEAKARLFTDFLAADGRGVINIDDPFGRGIAARIPTALTYGFGEGDIRCAELKEDADGMSASLMTPAGPIRIESGLIGRHNLYNLMAAAGGALVLGIAPERIAAGLGAFSNVPGRIERVALPKAFAGCRVFVDYAHTPDALERVILALRPTTDGRLITLFGCGGNRDRKKRPLMGEVAARWSDYTIVTSDNPRREEPLAIIGEVEAGVIRGGGRKGETYRVVADRREAIRTAAALVRDGDTVLIAGKGHEDYQILGDKKVHFDDREEAARAFDDAACRAEAL